MIKCHAEFQAIVFYVKHIQRLKEIVINLLTGNLMCHKHNSYYHLAAWIKTKLTKKHPHCIFQITTGSVHAMACKLQFIGTEQWKILNGFAMKARCASRMSEQRTPDDKSLNSEYKMQLTPKGWVGRRHLKSRMNQDECRSRISCSRIIRGILNRQMALKKRSRTRTFSSRKWDMIRDSNSLGSKRKQPL